MSSIEGLKYPIGRFSNVVLSSSEQRLAFIETIEACPSNLRASARSLSDVQLDSCYREDGWTVRQLIHHMFDSHANAYIRFRLALTEHEPKITAYNEAAWAELEDSFSVPVSVSLDLLDGLHVRWVATLRSMSSEDFARNLDHPEIGLVDLDTMLQLYAWHGLHHVAHITSLKERMGS